ncbi:MAG TPA: hypothetical protein VKP12_02385, partial [Kiloniellaceae bacterium]|nr:hypothetical protein [Kiloniellaceae bacterium]
MKMLSIGPLLIGAFVVLSIAAVAGGFLVIGTPGEQRMIALDKQRIGDLRRLARAVGAYWETHGELPPRLSDIDNDWVPQAADPESGQP